MSSSSTGDLQMRVDSKSPVSGSNESSNSNDEGNSDTTNKTVKAVTTAPVETGNKAKPIAELSPKSSEVQSNNEHTSPENSGQGSYNSVKNHDPQTQKTFGINPFSGPIISSSFNPFFISNSSAAESPHLTSSILAKPKFTLKPPSFGSSTGDHGDDTSLSDQHHTTNHSNSFIRPAKLTLDGEEDIRNPDLHTEKSDVLRDGKFKESESKQDELSKSHSGHNLLGSTSSEGFVYGHLTKSSSVNSSAFVFGEAIDDRVTNVSEKSKEINGHSEGEKPKAVKTLEEAVDEYRKQQESGPVLPEVETKTGEEDESNVLQINCKLYLFDEKNKNWLEKGRGLLRLNDVRDSYHSRIVMRNSGIHKVILNSSIWPAMLCERANQKSIRITGTDAESETVHVFLISGSINDMDLLHNALTYRIQREKVSQSTSSPSTDNSTNKRKLEESHFPEDSPKKARLDSEDASNDSSLHSPPLRQHE